MLCNALYEMIGLKTVFDDIVYNQKSILCITSQTCVYCFEEILIVQNVEVLDDVFVSNVAINSTCHLVKNRECIAHTTIGFLSYLVQCLHVCSFTLIAKDSLQLFYDI